MEQKVKWRKGESLGGASTEVGEGEGEMEGRRICTNARFYCLMPTILDGCWRV